VKKSPLDAINPWRQHARKPNRGRVRAAPATPAEPEPEPQPPAPPRHRIRRPRHEAQDRSPTGPRNCCLSVLLSEEEDDEINEAARAAGKTRSSWARLALLKAAERQR